MLLAGVQGHAKGPALLVLSQVCLRAGLDDHAGALDPNLLRLRGAVPLGHGHQEDELPALLDGPEAVVRLLRPQGLLDD